MGAIGRLSRKGNRLAVENVEETPKILFIEEFSLIHYFHEQSNPNSVFSWIDKIVAYGANGMRTSGIYVYDYEHAQQPFALINAGSGLQMQFNENFFKYMQRWLGYADERGVVVLFELFDNCLFFNGCEAYAKHDPFEPIVHCDLQTFLTNPQAQSFQRQYIDKVAQTVAPFNNVMFGVMNEYKGHKEWHYATSKYLKDVTEGKYLIAGSEEDSPAAADPNVDAWFVHTGRYLEQNSATGQHYQEACLGGDIGALNGKSGGSKILGFSNDGFGDNGPYEDPENMRRLASTAANKGLQLLGFMDHHAARREGEPIFGTLHPLNTATYKAMAEAFPPTDLKKQEQLPPGMLYVFQARRLDSPHPQAVDENGGKAIPATTTKGDLFVSPTICHSDSKPLPLEPLTVYFSLMIDDHVNGNANVATVEVCDAATDSILKEMVITRAQFGVSNQFKLFELTFTPTKASQLVFRVHYLGKARLTINKMALVERDKLTLKAPKEISDNAHSSTSTVPDKPELDPNKKALYSYELIQNPNATHPNVFVDKGAKAVTATTTKGFLAYGPYATGYPAKPLDVYFSVLIDNNTHDNAKILSLDVYDAFAKKILAQTSLTRKQFPLAGDYSLFKLRFTPNDQSQLEFRIYYEGYAYIAADWIVVVEPEKIAAIKNHAELLKLVKGTSEPPKGWKLAIEDPLTNKTSKAIEIAGGELVSDGCKITGKVNSYLRYDTDIKGAIRVEFDAKGYIPGEPMHGTNDQVSLLVMQDVPHPTNWANWKTIDGFLFQLLKMAKYDATDGLKLKAGAALRTSFDGEWWTVMGHGEVGHPLTWDTSKTYHWDVVFEPEILQVKRDGQLIFTFWIDPLVFGKKNTPIVVYIGGDYGANNISPNNVTYSNVKIYRKV